MTIIGFPLVEYFDLMDVANPYEIFNWMKPFWSAGAADLSVLLIGHEKDANVVSFNGAALKTTACFDDVPQLDTIFVPGGGDAYIEAALADTKLIDFVRNQSEQAKWVSSVCTGAFVLAKAGLLDGRRATTHWMYLSKLQSDYPKVEVVNGFPRYVADGKFMTGGGISSGVDEALTLAGKIGGEQVGRDIELAIQYRPHPPYGTGDPSVADYTTWKQVTTDLS
jgi:cyclohexyl-isocyanide hydratase